MSNNLIKYAIFNPEKNSFWLPMGMGYTKKEQEAGQFTLNELANFNLDNQVLRKLTSNQAEDYSDAR